MVYISLYLTQWEGDVYTNKMSFDDRAHYKRWRNLEQRIKSTIAHINYRREIGEVSGDNAKTLLSEWLTDLAYRMPQEFGDQRVPIDIRHAINDAEAVLGREITDFGEEVGRLSRRN